MYVVCLDSINCSCLFWQLLTGAIYLCNSILRINWVTSCIVVGWICLDDNIIEIEGLGKVWKGKLNYLGILEASKLKPTDDNKAHDYSRNQF